MEGSSSSPNITSNNGKLVLLVVFDFKIVTLISSTFACLSQSTIAIRNNTMTSTATKAGLSKLFGHNLAKQDKKICKKHFDHNIWRWNQLLHVAWRNFVIRLT
jgi:ABC-type Mn2+/Zn2+ transport system ATPase subunit